MCKEEARRGMVSRGPGRQQPYQGTPFTGLCQERAMASKWWAATVLPRVPQIKSLVHHMLMLAARNGWGLSPTPHHLR
jgi:hypothetical protein